MDMYYKKTQQICFDKGIQGSASGWRWEDQEYSGGTKTTKWIRLASDWLLWHWRKIIHEAANP